MTGARRRRVAHDPVGERLRRVLDTIQSYTALLDPAGRVVEVNRIALVRSGTERDGVIGRPFWEHSCWQHDPAVVTRIRDATRRAGAGATVRFETSATTTAGRRVTLDLTLTPVRGDDTVTEIVASALDVTRARRIETSLQRRELLHRYVVDGVAQGIVVHASDGTIIACNAAAERLLGLATVELLGRTFFDTHWEAASDEHPASITLRTGRPAQATFTIRHGDGQRRWLSVTSQPLRRGRYGAADGVITFFTDVSEERRVAEDLDDRDARLRAVLETAVDAVVTLGGSGYIESFNPAAERLFGWPAAEIIGRHARELLPPGTLGSGTPEVDAWIAADASDRPPLTAEVRCRTRDGQIIPVRLSVGEATVRGRRLLTAIVHDLRERHRTEALLRESATLAATGRIAARIAHEINNPLAGLKNAFALLEDAVDTSHPYARYLPMIMREIERIARIVRQALDLYRPEARPAQPISVRATVQEVAILVETAAAARGIVVVTRHASGADLVAVVEDAVRQILHNLLANAVDASPPDSHVSVVSEVDATHLTLTVHDEGPGIPADLAKAIYEPFFTTKVGAATMTGGGVGLGLATSRALATALGGRLDHTSGPETGTTFRVELPLGIVAGHQQPGA